MAEAQIPAATPTPATGPAPRAAFATERPLFVDFGCGRGDSMRVAEKIMRGPGAGIDISAERVAAAREQGLDVVEGDVLAFEERNIATAAFALDLVPELEGRRALETACANMLRAATDFVILQHLCFDSVEALLARGVVAPDHLARAVRYRPRIADYVHFVQQFGARHEIVGFAAFGMGEVKVEPCGLSGLGGAMFAMLENRPVYRSVRIIMARKASARFQTALRRAGTGDALLIWEAPGS